MTDILDSVIEDIKQEKLNHSIRKYGKILIVGIILLLIIGLLFNWWRSYQEGIVLREAGEYVKIHQMLNNVRSQQALVEGLGKLEKLSTDGQTVYAALAGLTLANVYDAMGQFVKAAHFYGNIADNPKVDPSLRNFANLMQVSANLRAQKITTDEAMTAIHEKHRSASFATSRQILEVSLLIEAGKKDEARAILENMRATATEEQQGGIVELLLGLTVN